MNYKSVTEIYLEEIYEMIERNIFSASPRITKFDSYILNRYSHAYIYNALEDLKNLRFELEKKIGFKNKDISKILINNNINRLIKFYKSWIIYISLRLKDGLKNFYQFVYLI